MKQYLLRTVFIAACITLAFDTDAQTNRSELHRVFIEDSTDADAIALYPAEVRTSIFESCMYPQTLVQMGNMQKDTKEQFKELLSGYTKEVQSDLWNLTRYPGLIEELGGKEQKNNVELNAIAEKYPAEIKETILSYGKNYHETLSKIDRLNRKNAHAFDSLVSVSTKAGQTSFQKIVQYPEVVSMLNNNMRMAVQLGDLQKRDPAMLASGFDSLNIVLARQHVQDIEDWKNGLEKDPEAKQEFERSTQEYQESEGDVPSTTVTEQVVVQYVYYSYPYWYGYPWWWEYPHWYPYPYWYDWGYYYGPYGIVYMGCPSHHYMHWYFHQHHSHYHYPHFSSYCTGYYYGHHRTATGLNRNMDQWVKENADVMPNGFLNNDPGRPDRMQEFGKFEEQYNNYNVQHPDKPLSKRDYLAANPDFYPRLSPVLNEKPGPPKQKGDVKNDQPWNTPPVEQPKTNVPKQKGPPVQQPKTTVPKQKGPPVQQPKTSVPKQKSPPVKQPVTPKTTTPSPKTGKKK